jgi:PST family polysaccharide transporter
LTSESANTDAAQITRKAGRGIVWNFLAHGLGKFTLLLTTAILARLLTKNDFGLVAVAVIAINYLSVIKDLGLGLALIQRREDVETAANTVFTVNLMLGAALSAIAFLIAPWVAAYFKDPMVTPVLRWLGSSFFINALGSVHIIRLMRELDYRRKFIPDMGNALVKSAASIGLALAGFGVWALVFGQILGALASVMLVWIVLPWRPRFAFDGKIIAALSKFGAPVLGEDILTAIVENIDYIVAGRIFGLQQLSIYTLAYRLPEMLLIGNLWIMAGVTFPAFSSIQDKPDEMRRGLLASIRFVQLFAVPAAWGLFIAADPIVRFFFGDQWLDAIPLLRVLALYAWIYSIGYHVGDIYKAIGRPDIQLRLTAFTLTIVIPAILIGSRFGLIGIACGHLLTILIRQAVSLTVATRFVNVTFVDIFKELKPAVIGGLAMLFAASAALALAAGFNPFAQLALVVCAGAAGYLGILWVTERESLTRLFRAIGVPL